MRQMRMTFILAALAVCVVAAQSTADHQVGTWKLNVAKSKLADPTMAPKSAVTTIEATAGGVKVSVNNVQADGTKVQYSFTAKYDGKEYPVKGDPSRDSVAITKKDDYTFQFVSKLKGATTSDATVVYSKDGKTRTVTVTGTNEKGQTGTNVQVYDRQ
jgi:uncharacterized protein YcfL